MEKLSTGVWTSQTDEKIEERIQVGKENGLTGVRLSCPERLILGGDGQVSRLRNVLAFMRFSEMTAYVNCDIRYTRTLFNTLSDGTQVPKPIDEVPTADEIMSRGKDIGLVLKDYATDVLLGFCLGNEWTNEIADHMNQAARAEREGLKREAVEQYGLAARKCSWYTGVVHAFMEGLQEVAPAVPRFAPAFGDGVWGRGRLLLEYLAPLFNSEVLNAVDVHRYYAPRDFDENGTRDSTWRDLEALLNGAGVNLNKIHTFGVGEFNIRRDLAPNQQGSMFKAAVQDLKSRAAYFLTLHSYWAGGDDRYQVNPGDEVSELFKEL